MRLLGSVCVVGLALGVAGCTIDVRPGYDYTILTNDLSPAQLAEVQAAVADWQANVPLTVHYRPTHPDLDYCGGCIAIIYIPSKDLVPIVPGVEGYACYGGSSHEKIVYIGQDTSPATRLQVVKHELGHAFGLSHNPNKGVLMYAYTSGASMQVMPADAQAFMVARSE